MLRSRNNVHDVRWDATFDPLQHTGYHSSQSSPTSFLTIQPLGQETTVARFDPQDLAIQTKIVQSNKPSAAYIAILVLFDLRTCFSSPVVLVLRDLALGDGGSLENKDGTHISSSKSLDVMYEERNGILEGWSVRFEIFGCCAEKA